MNLCTYTQLQAWTEEIDRENKRQLKHLQVNNSLPIQKPLRKAEPRTRSVLDGYHLTVRPSVMQIFKLNTHKGIIKHFKKLKNVKKKFLIA